MTPESGVFFVPKMNKSKKPIVYTENPFSYDAVMKARKDPRRDDIELTPTASQLIQNPTAHDIGLWLGLDMNREWNQFYDKVNFIYQWAKQHAGGSEDPRYLILLLKEKLNSCPQMSDRRLVDLWAACKLDNKMKKESEEVK